MIKLSKSRFKVFINSKFIFIFTAIVYTILSILLTMSFVNSRLCMAALSVAVIYIYNMKFYLSFFIAKGIKNKKFITLLFVNMGLIVVASTAIAISIYFKEHGGYFNNIYRLLFPSIGMSLSVYTIGGALIPIIHLAVICDLNNKSDIESPVPRK